MKVLRAARDNAGPSTMLVLSLVLCAPSYFAWFRHDVFLGELEFDWWLGLGLPIVWGRVAHTLLFGLLGFVYVSLLLARHRLPSWLPLSMLAIFGFAVPWVSPDVSFYLAEGWLEAHYGADPYVVSMLAVDASNIDPIIRSVAPTIRPVVGNYGAFFQELSRGIAVLSGGHPMLGLLLFKAIAVASLIVVNFEIEKVVHQNEAGRSYVRWILLCNPLVLFNAVTAVHNDIIFLVPVAIAMRQLWSRPWLAGLLLGISISLKLFSLFLLPVWTISLARSAKPDRTRSVAALLAFSVLGWGVGFLPNPESIAYVLKWIDNDSSLIRPSLHLIAEPLVSLITESSGVTSMLLGKIAFVVLSLMFLARNHRTSSRIGPDFMIRSSFEVLLLMHALVLYMINEWYLLWPMIFAAAAITRRQDEWVVHTSFLIMPIVIWSLNGAQEVMVVAYALLVVVYGSAILLQLRQNWTGQSTRYSLARAIRLREASGES